MKRLQRNVNAEYFFCQTLQEHTCNKTVEVALVGENYFRPRQLRHGTANLAKTTRTGERLVASGGASCRQLSHAATGFVWINED
jgi:hypothetical protein